MRSHRIYLLFAGAFCLGLLIVALFTRREREELRHRQNLTMARKATLQTELIRAQAAASRSVSGEKPPPSATSVDTSTSDTPARRPILRAPGLVDLARDNPGLWNEWIEAKKAEFAQRYGPLLQRLRLSPEQRARFKEIMAAATARSVDIAAAMDAQLLSRNDPTIVALTKQSEMQTDTDLTALLGPPGLAVFKEYQRTIQVRGLMDGLAVQLAGIEPLSAQQADRLAEVMAFASPAFRSGGQAVTADVDWPSVDEHAKSILSPAQFEIWRQGTAHNPYGGSRQEVEFTKLYDQTVKAMKATGRG
jgi:hypothetical protein